MMFSVVFLIVGCAKESFDSKESETILKSQKTVPMYVLQNTDGELSYELQDVVLTAPDKPSANSQEKLAFINHAHGVFTGFRGISFQFKSTNYTNGTGGGGIFIQQLPFGEANMIMETECLFVEGNEAVYAGTFVDGVNPFPGSPTPFDLGNTVYFKVRDNGPGQVDQYYSSFFAISNGTLDCDEINFLGFGTTLSDISGAEDQIKVKTF
ncbi:MAG: hypothetical protein O2867_08400 [Bacteroidetes bacterium]|nr:hypothetical protein [Bacteroidota bacterium]